MTMYPPSEQASYSPSHEQLEREHALKRYNRLYIYIPVAIATTIALSILILMLIGIFAPGLVGAEVFLSGLADTILVLWMMPMMVLCAIVPIAYAGYLVNRRQRRRHLPLDSPLLRHSRTQMALWQAQDITEHVEKTSARTSDRIARPFIRLDSFAAFVFAWLATLARPLRKDSNYDPVGVRDPDGID